jgi:type VI secretion system protein ImpM
MPQPVTASTGVQPSEARAVGFCGKIPSRGDFVSRGLPHSFIEPWDRWVREGIAASRALLGDDDWVASWLEAAIWSFGLAPGICGADAVVGVWMPSVDRVGRHFPLTLAAVIPGGTLPDIVSEYGGFLAAAERAGLAALESDITPDELARRTSTAAAAPPADPGIDAASYPTNGALWWTQGTARVPPGAFFSCSMPEPVFFAQMLDARGGQGGR